MTARPKLGIDLGTTYTCVAALNEYGQASVLPNQEGDLTTPSVVYYERGGNVIVGKFAKNELKSDPDRVVSLIKRHMGEEGYTVEVDGKELYPQQVSSVILRQVVEDALGNLGLDVPSTGPLAEVVITVPAYFGAAERQATRDAGEMAGLSVVNIINEPTAAAIAYGLLSGGTERTVLVYDLGGGTFDVTIIKVSAAQIKVVATGGDHSLGGADWDQRLSELIAAKFQEQHPDADDPRYDQDAVGSIDLLAETAKKALSRRETYVDTLSASDRRAKLEISREEFEQATADLVDRTIDFTRDVVEQARAKGVTKVDEVLLVGGMSHSPVIKRRLAEALTDLPEGRLTDPDQIVAKGAALFAATSVSEGSDGSGADSRPLTVRGAPVPTIVDVTSKGYGVAVVRDRKRSMEDLIVAWLIKPNDEIPVDIKETLYTVSVDQPTMQIQVFESTTDQLSENLSDHVQLVTGDLTNLPAGPAGEPVAITFALGSDAILRIRAVAANGSDLALEAKISGQIPDEVKRSPLPTIVR
ncbi:Hsp70 family protein [Actinokineospora cianjurensis]|uniref:Molecular chaperone DnaK n=1 Tax=Actinokineospora cianjurensis TaxID=585224 RepID=A0A421AWH6_9PSEU|nr:Hsp70 family protein [Actinokineospora cianjurensis]RLK54190.1 molecular chaperone DnaK [Actinokineospora cianjurensis]